MALARHWWFFAATAAIAATSARAAAPTEISFCELSANPQKYIGRTIRVLASYSPTLNGTPALFNEHCSDGYILPLVEENGSFLKNLRDYRAEGTALKGAFRVWGIFAGSIIKEKPSTDPYLQGDDGFHFQAIDVQDIRAIGEP